MPAAITYAVLVDSMPLRPAAVTAIESVEVDSKVGIADICRIRFATALSDDGNRWLIADDAVFRRLSPLQLLVQTGAGLPTVVFDGVVTETKMVLSSDRGVSHFEVVAMDRTLEMNLVEKVREWPAMPDSAIAMSIFAEYGMLPIANPTTIVRNPLETTVLQRDTDIRFLRHLAARNGFDVYVRPGPVPTVSEGHFHAPVLDMPPQGVLSIDLGGATNVESFAVRTDMVRASSVRAAGVNARQVEAQQAEVTSASESTLGRSGTVGTGTRTTLARPDGLNVDNELRASSQSAVDRSSWGITATGELDPSVYGDLLRPAMTVLVRGAGATHSGTYYVEGVTHHIVGERFRQRFKLRRNAVEPTGTEVYLTNRGLP